MRHNRKEIENFNMSVIPVFPKFFLKNFTVNVKQYIGVRTTDIRPKTA